jgi:uncharacterized protein (DUF1499 family)
MRRLIIEEPFSAAAIWSRRLAVFALALGGIAVALARAASLEISAVLAVLGTAIFCACAAVLFAASAAVIIWRTGRRGVGTLLGGAILALIVLAWPAYLTAQAIRLPVINDISTDLVDPPTYYISARADAARGGRRHHDIPPEWRDQQRRAYPDVQPIVLDADEAWQLVQKAVAVLGWSIVQQGPPGGRAGLGHIDAVDKSLVMGFPDDITIRVRPLAGQTRIDVRSASRYGRHDFGTNARRIQRFATELQTQLDAR